MIAQGAAQRNGAPTKPPALLPEPKLPRICLRFRQFLALQFRVLRTCKLAPSTTRGKNPGSRRWARAGPSGEPGPSRVCWQAYRRVLNLSACCRRLCGPAQKWARR